MCNETFRIFLGLFVIKLPLHLNTIYFLKLLRLFSIKRESRDNKIRSLSMPSISCCTSPHVFTSFARLKKRFNGYLLFTAPGPNLYLTTPAPNLCFTPPALNLCLRVLCFTVKVYYSYSVYLYKP